MKPERRRLEEDEVMDTFGIPGTRVYRDSPLWRKDPRTAVLPETLQSARSVGYAGPPGRKATEALSKFIMVDMYAKTLQGMKAEDAVKWAEGELKRIYEG
jgi:multiple sugar transport system substrate-binding protein